MEVFDDTFVAPGLSKEWTAALHCPRCVWPYLQPVRSLDESHLLCESCGHCWRVEHGRLQAVDPVACHGCGARPKRECIDVLRSEFPRFGTPDDAGDESP
jgi:hypothetical protein